MCSPKTISQCQRIYWVLPRYVISIELPTLNLSFLREGTGLMLILMCVPLAFSLLNRFTHNLPLEAPLIYIPSLAFVGHRIIAPMGAAGRVRGIRTLT